MPEKSVSRLNILFPKGQPEDSTSLRVAVGVPVMVSIVALIAQDIASNSVAFGVLVLTPVGMFVSYFRRHKRNIPLKIGLAAAAIAALADFLGSLSGATSVEAARAPLAEIFLSVQTIHSFDLPRRRDLHFSLASSVTLMALAGSLALDSTFIIFFLPWGISALVALYLAHVSEVGQGVPTTVTAPGAPRFTVPALRSIGAIALVVLVIGGVAFGFAPRIGSSRFTALAFQLPRLVPVPKGAGIINPGLPNQSSPGDSVFTPSPDTYWGFANFVDLRVRGDLSDDVVMRVRSPRAAFWRGGVYDVYSKSSWSDSTTTPTELGTTPVQVPRDTGLAFDNSRVELVQTFYIVKPQPNLVFAAYHPRQIWFPVGGLEVTDHLSIRSPTLLEPDSVYSVISRVPVPTEQMLEALPGQVPKNLERYLQLPPELPARVRNLAHRIASPHPTIAGKVKAVEDWLGANTRYSLDIPPQPRGTDAVDHFLFEEKEGFCEQIATSMVVMLRSVGIPARFATGYAPGERNMLTGFFEVKQSDAHSWVEVFYPKVGWMEYDPTHEVPAVQDTRESLPGVKIFQAVGRGLGKLVPDGMGRVVGAVFRAAFGWIASSGARAGGALATVAAAVGVFVYVRPRVAAHMTRRRARKRIAGGPKQMVIASFGLVSEAGARAGVARQPSLTPGEYGARLVRLRGLPATQMGTLVSCLERTLYANVSPSQQEADLAVDTARGLADALDASVKGSPLG